MDLHAAQIQGFFNIPVDHLLGGPILANYYSKKFENDKENVVCVSPDHGSVTRVRAFAERLDLSMAIIDKRRPKANVCEKAILVDDMIDTAGTICNAADALAERGATEVYACCTHSVLSGPAIERIQKSAIKELVVLDTVPLSDEKKIDKIKTLSVAPMFAEAISRIFGEQSISTLFI